MPQNIVTVKTLLFGSSGNIVLTTVAAIGLNEQIKETRHFAHLDLPLWVFFVFVFVLSFVGAIASLYTDTMQTSVKGRIANFLMGVGLGIIGAFIILPTFTSDPNVELMMLTSLAFSFSGTVLLHNLSRILRSDELSDGITKTAGEAGNIIKSRILNALRALFGELPPEKGGNDND